MTAYAGLNSTNGGGNTGWTFGLPPYKWFAGTHSTDAGNNSGWLFGYVGNYCTDAGVGTEAIALLAKTLTDSGVGSEAAAALSVLLQKVDSGTGVDASTLAVLIALIDSAVGSDIATPIVAVLTATDAGVGVDSATKKVLLLTRLYLLLTNRTNLVVTLEGGADV